MMRVVVVNHTHPSVSHVSGMRAWHFAQALAARGHQVMLICERPDTDQPGPDAPALEARVRDHDWRRPLVVAVKPPPVALLVRVRAAGTKSWLRKALVAWSFVRRSGVFTDFSEGAQPFLEPIARAFKPQVVWGTFLNTDYWLVAQRLARLAGCGWVGDMKDAWDWWIPVGLRTLLARRFGDMAASTANAAFHAEAMARWFPARPAVVYSGVDPGWIRAEPPPVDGFPVMLVGGTYSRQDLVRFVGGFAAWVRSVPPADRARIRLCYAGTDTARVESVVGDLATLIQVDIRGYLPLADLAALCGAAAVNVYLWSPTTFHHKVAELLSCRRPIISFPGERAESVELARCVGGSLNVCHSDSELRMAFDDIWNGGRQPGGSPEALQSLTWDAQARHLEAVLRGVALEGPD